MPVLLTKPWSPGDNDPNAGEGYKFAQLSALYHNGLTMGITLEWQFGTASGDYYEIWQRGPGSPTKSVDVPGAQVVPLWSQSPNAGESVGEAIRRVTYQFLIDQGYVAGTIVNNPPLPPVAPATTTSAPADSTAPATTTSAPADSTAPATTTSAPADSSTTAAPTAPSSTTTTPAS